MTPDKDMPLGNGPPLNRQPTGNPYNSTNTTSFDSSSTVATGGTFSISDFRTMTASFPPAGSASTPYSGQRCVFPGACSPDSSISIFPLRWSVTQGLASAASFSVTASPSGTYPIHVAVQFSIQSSSAAVADSFTPQITSFPAPTVSGGIKTYTIHFANLTVSSGDALSNLQASISVKPDGTLVNSYFKFTKDLPQTLSTDWNPLSPDASLTTGQTYFNVPGVTYTMNLSR